jgi:hypothetical protein
MDDFLGTLKAWGQSALAKGKQFLSENKDVVLPFARLALSKLTGLDPSLMDKAFTVFGGDLESEDPYAIDVKYVRGLYGLGPISYMPRFASHYMSFIQQRYEIPVTTILDGTALCIINPTFGTSVKVPNAFAGTGSFVPFAWVAATSTTTPYANNPSFSLGGPLNGVTSQVAGFGWDSVIVDYIHTESINSTKGRF